MTAAVLFLSLNSSAHAQDPVGVWIMKVEPSPDVVLTQEQALAFRVLGHTEVTVLPTPHGGLELRMQGGGALATGNLATTGQVELEFESSALAGAKLNGTIVDDRLAGTITATTGVLGEWSLARHGSVYACGNHAPEHVAASSADVVAYTQSYSCRQWHVLRAGEPPTEVPTTPAPPTDVVTLPEGD